MHEEELILLLAKDRCNPALVSLLQVNLPKEAWVIPFVLFERELLTLNYT